MFSVDAFCSVVPLELLVDRDVVHACRVSLVRARDGDGDGDEDGKTTKT